MKISLSCLKFSRFLVISVACIASTVVSTGTAQAEETSFKSSLLSGKSIFSSCANSTTGNAYCWSTQLIGNKMQSMQAPVAMHLKAHPIRATIAERAAAMALSLIVEYTTSKSFNEIKIK